MVRKSRRAMHAVISSSPERAVTQELEMEAPHKISVLVLLLALIPPIYGRCAICISS